MLTPVIITGMNTESALLRGNPQLRLHTFLSASFPTGAYTYSHGIETAIQDNRISDADSCLEWIANIVRLGSGWNDALLLCEAHALLDAHRQIDAQALQTTNDLALALSAGEERYRETMQMGSAFLRAAANWPDTQHEALSGLENLISLPVAIGIIGALNRIPLNHLLPVSLQASTSNLVWIATRLVPLGQSDSLLVIGTLEPILSSVSEQAMNASLEDLGGCNLLGDMASIEHEVLDSRVCST